MPNKHDNRGRTKQVQVRFAPDEYAELVELMFRARKRSPAQYIREALELKTTARIEAKAAKGVVTRRAAKAA